MLLQISTSEILVPGDISAISSSTCIREEQQGAMFDVTAFQVGGELQGHMTWSGWTAT